MHVPCSLSLPLLPSSCATRMRVKWSSDDPRLTAERFIPAAQMSQRSSEGSEQCFGMFSLVLLGLRFWTIITLPVVQCSIPKCWPFGATSRRHEPMQIAWLATRDMTLQQMQSATKTVRVQAAMRTPRRFILVDLDIPSKWELACMWHGVCELVLSERSVD